MPKSQKPCGKTNRKFSTYQLLSLQSTNKQLTGRQNIHEYSPYTVPKSRVEPSTVSIPLYQGLYSFHFGIRYSCFSAKLRIFISRFLTRTRNEFFIAYVTVGFRCQQLHDYNYFTSTVFTFQGYDYHFKPILHLLNLLFSAHCYPLLPAACHLRGCQAPAGRSGAGSLAGQHQVLVLSTRFAVRSTDLIHLVPSPCYSSRTRQRTWTNSFRASTSCLFGTTKFRESTKHTKRIQCLHQLYTSQLESVLCTLFSRLLLCCAGRERETAVQHSTQLLVTPVCHYDFAYQQVARQTRHMVQVRHTQQKHKSMEYARHRVDT